MQKFRQLPFKLKMQPQRTVEKARARAARAERPIRLHARLDNIGASRQTQIIVGAQHDAALTLHHDLGILPRFQRVEIGIQPHLANFIGH